MNLVTNEMCLFVPTCVWGGGGGGGMVKVVMCGEVVHASCKICIHIYMYLLFRCLLYKSGRRCSICVYSIVLSSVVSFLCQC